ncbi:MAG: hypothetical protein MR210_02290 [Erysipelotrichaceae bacterium]|nr:hypothetical protein [Erysipelotrichaceae bacterium]MDY5251118.1 hypothetical protein [Erysipelotrichaceae bacterium]
MIFNLENTKKIKKIFFVGIALELFLAFLLIKQYQGLFIIATYSIMIIMCVLINRINKPGHNISIVTIILMLIFAMLIFDCFRNGIDGLKYSVLWRPLSVLLLAVFDVF